MLIAKESFGRVLRKDEDALTRTWVELATKTSNPNFAVLAGDKRGFGAQGSGRLELAELVASPKNPLTARVFVNRVWHWLFGTGISKWR